MENLLSKSLPPIFLLSLYIISTIAISFVSSNPNPALQQQISQAYFPKHYAENPNIHSPTVSLHTKPKFGGQELFFDGTWLSLPKAYTFHSHRFTGRINWTTYPHSNYSGQPTCLIADPEEPVTYNEEWPITVGSIRRGCWCNYSIKVTPRPKHGRKISGVNLYTGHNAVGRWLFTDGFETRLPDPINMKSFRLVGQWKKWTVYPRDDLTGESYCLAHTGSGDDWPSHTDIRETFSVKSIRQGCAGQKTFEAFGGIEGVGEETISGGGNGLMRSQNGMMHIGIAGFIALGLGLMN